MLSQKERLLKELEKYGIHNEEELDKAIEQKGFVDIGIFTGDYLQKVKAV